MSVPLHLQEYQRYGRQMILDNFGLEVQLKLRASAVAIIGAGGLGCPVAQYLAGAGVGRIAVCDGDVVELSNLQRQVLHTEDRLHTFKAESVAIALRQLNSDILVEPITEPITSENAVQLLRPYDVLVDCTDNPATRYLLSDVAVYLQKPLVSGAAQRFEGQVVIYNLDNTGPCYRCLFPKPPRTAMSCEETGILGAVTGVIGSMQALETIKIIGGLHDHKSVLLLFSALSTPPFRTVNLRKRQPTCPACSNPNHSIQTMDYIQFCGGPPTDWVENGQQQGQTNQRITPKSLKELLEDTSKSSRIIDVRSKSEFSICSIPNSINVPLRELLSNPASYASLQDTYLVCRLGNDSQVAAQCLREASSGLVQDLQGGLVMWAKSIDKAFPVY